MMKYTREMGKLPYKETGQANASHNTHLKVLESTLSTSTHSHFKVP